MFTSLRFELEVQNFLVIIDSFSHMITKTLFMLNIRIKSRFCIWVSDALMRCVAIG